MVMSLIGQDCSGEVRDGCVDVRSHLTIVVNGCRSVPCPLQFARRPGYDRTVPQAEPHRSRLGINAAVSTAAGFPQGLQGHLIAHQAITRSAREPLACSCSTLPRLEGYRLLAQSCFFIGSSVKALAISYVPDKRLSIGFFFRCKPHAVHTMGL